MNRITRRNFLQGSVAAGASLALPRRIMSQQPKSNVLGANDDVRVAVVGFNGQGKYHIWNLQNIPGVRIVALCDLDEETLKGDSLKKYLMEHFNQTEKFREKQGNVAAHVDVRRVLDDPGVDAIVIATPDHWHALIAIWACQAGKDVYVEKPISHDVWEGAKLVEAARKYDRIVQAGTQRRSDQGMPEMVQYLQEGNLGEMRVAYAMGYWGRPSLGNVAGPQSPPATIDYNAWCGPGPLEPLLRKRLHYDWRFFWNPGSGELPNNGVHFVDLVRWILKEDSLSAPVMSVGGRFVWNDCGQTPNSMFTVWDTKPVPIICGIRNLPRKTGDTALDHVKDVRAGVVVECEHGCVAGGWAYDNEGNKLKQFRLDQGGQHMANFIKAVRSRKQSDLNADILKGHISSSMCILGNISYRVGKALPADEIKESLQGNAVAHERFTSFQAHMEANGVNPAEDMATIGPWIKFDPDKMRISTDHPTAELMANTLLKPKYREPFVVPDQV